ncbi:tetratricopeptide repeat protein [Streptomyces sp. NPDC002817]|uniref:tetratricopeptide repeat protein n=1 Tax=Streptomyces sp. NPDC088357 TaxID=3154655 RepID=UPI0034310A70
MVEGVDAGGFVNSAAGASGERAIASAQGIRQALSGDGVVAMYAEKALPPEAFALPESAPERLVNLPDRTALFVGRRRELALLDTTFRESNDVVVQAVHGLGGIGKSTLAAHWAAGRVRSYNPVWWITAESPADLDAGLAEFAVALQPALRDVLSREALRERAVQWLAGHEGWLLVLDNVSDPADVKALLGRAPGGRFLITTRRASGWHKVAEALSLDVLEPAEAIELFERIDGSGEDVEALCRELGHLPLAVEQSAAYCAEAGITSARYRELLAAYPEEVFAQSAEGTDQDRTVARVWRVSLDRLADTPLAGRILGVIAWWASEGIPRAYLELLGSPVEVTEAIRRLAAHSLIKVHDDDTISVHRLVQAVGRAEFDASHEAAHVLLDNSRTLRAVDAELTWLMHLEAMAGRTDPENDDEYEAWLFHMGGFTADAARAVELHERAAAAAERAFGPNDETTLTMRGHLAQSHGYAGDRIRAIELLEENLADHVRVFGPRSKLTFEARSALADAMVEAGRFADALSLARANVRSAEQTLGDRHQTVLRARSTWAKALRRAVETDTDSDATVAAHAIEELLVKVSAVEGEDSMIFDICHWQLIWVCKSAGDIERAAAHFEECITRRGRIFGETDGVTLSTRRAFVRFLRDTVGDLGRARDQAALLLADWERLVGETAYVRDLRQDFAPLLTPPQV